MQTTKVLRGVQILLLVLGFHVFMGAGCKKDVSPNPTPTPPSSEDLGSVDSWMTTGNQGILLEKQTPLKWTTSANNNAVILGNTRRILKPKRHMMFNLLLINILLCHKLVNLL